MEHLFSWDKIPGNDNLKLIEFLRQNFSIDWIENTKIKKIDGTIIKASSREHLLLLRLNDEKTRVNLMIDDGRTDNFIVTPEDGELNIYKQGESKVNIVSRHVMTRIIEPTFQRF